MSTFGSYHQILREERHLGAILYHLMQNPTSLNEFIEFTKTLAPDTNFTYDASQVQGIYYEYAALRDIWKSISDCFKKDGSVKEGPPAAAPISWVKETLSTRKSMKHGPESFTDADWVKRQFILGSLSKAGGKQTANYLKEVSNRSTAPESRKAFNCFVARNSINHKAIQSPSNWGAGPIAQEICKCISDPTELKQEIEKALMFKWSFNIKPDIVVELKGRSVLCIELKYESGESSYPSSNDRKTLKEALHKTDISIQSTDQLALQKFMLTKILEFKHCAQFLITKSGTGTINGIGNLTWKQAFDSLANRFSDSLRPEIQELIERVSDEE